jgi:hypothetical protein
MLWFGSKGAETLEIADECGKSRFSAEPELRQKPGR